MITQSLINNTSDQHPNTQVLRVRSIASPEKNIYHLIPHTEEPVAETPENSGRDPYPNQYCRSLFVERLTQLIEDNITDENYSIDCLCRDAGAGRTTIHNQLKRWTGLSTSRFIRRIRLKKAKIILLTTDLNITQVAFEVGFRDSHYFTRVFSQSFGLSPKAFRRRGVVMEVI